jgi:radical SAM protein with 4Fe4S-binding SPASM domain
MDISLFEKIMKEAAGKSELAILHLMGEPLINREIVKMIPLCKKANIKSVISTNAMLLNDEMANAICSSGLDTIILSFDGVSKETFEKVRFKAKYDTVKNNIERFLKRKHKPHTVVQMISFDLTDSERSQFKELWKGYNVDVLIKPYTNWQGDNDQINSWCRTDIAGLRYRTCDRLWKWATITQNGTMIPCCRDYDATVPFGNIKDHSIANIWNGSEFQNFRMQHSLGRERCSICKNCDYRAIIYDNFLAQLGTTVFDSYAILRLMYDMNYLSSE